MASFLRVARAAVSICAAAVIGCGEPGSTPGTPSGPAPPAGGAVPISGNERLAWDQAAPSVERLRRHSYVLYVDGVRLALSQIQCTETASSNGYPCSGRLPQMASGTHTLELASIENGAESPRSTPLLVVMGGGRIVLDAAPSAASVPGQICTAHDECFTVQHVITRPVNVSSPALAPDGRLFFVEDGRAVRVVADGVLVGEPAYVARDPQVRLTALLVDPQFEKTRQVRLAWIESTARQERRAVLAVLRNVENRLGEPAVIVPSIPLPPDGEPRVAQDDRGRLYVSVPADREHGFNDPYAGRILRFEGDGRTASGSPVFAAGFDRPTALAFDGVTSDLWVADGGDTARNRLVRVGVADGRASIAPTAMPSSQVLALVPLPPRQVTDTHVLLFADGSGALLSASAGPAGVAALTPVPFGSAPVTSAAAAGKGSAFVVTASPQGAPPSFSIYRLDPASIQ